MLVGLQGSDAAAAASLHQFSVKKYNNIRLFIPLNAYEIFNFLNIRGK
jgi:hypothetical protein